MSMCVHVYVHGYVRTPMYLRLYLRVPSPFLKSFGLPVQLWMNE